MRQQLDSVASVLTQGGTFDQEQITSRKNKRKELDGQAAKEKGVRRGLGL